MARTLEIAYLNGKYLPISEASISPLDRGFLFGDGVYEVVPIYRDQPLLLDAHLTRLEYSLRELSIHNPHSISEWKSVISTLAERNGGGDLTIYLQISRGADSGRDQVFPESLRSTVFAMAAQLQSIDYSAGVSAITLPDNRWARCDIKSTSLLANVLARETAAKQGAIDAILIRDGKVTEAAVSSVLLVENGDLVRRFNSQAILPGTTTDFVVELAGKAGYVCREEEVTEQQLRQADEIWLTGATKGIAPVVQLDGKTIGSGQPGPVWKKVVELFEARKGV